MRKTDTARECQQLGINVGDNIVGRETYASGGWSEARLTLLWVGRRIAVWRVRERTSEKRRWGPAEESSMWTLRYRTWKRV
jgi:hypothetical protein